MSKKDIKVGDLVVAIAAPNSVQRVVKVVLHDRMPDDSYLTMVSAWRLDCEPDAKTTRKEALTYGYRKATREELVAAAQRLLKIAQEVQESV